MAPATQKRKRGRAPAAAAQTDASTTKRTSRKRNTEQAEDRDAERPNKRARKPTAAAAAVEEEAANDQPDESSRRRSARDRNSGGSSNWWQNGEEPPEGTPQNTKPTKAAKRKAENAQPAKRPGRPSPDAGEQRRRPGRPSLDAGAKPRRPGRPRTSDTSTGAPSPAAGTPSRAKANRASKTKASRGVKRPASPEQPDSASGPKKRRRRRSEPTVEEQPEGEEEGEEDDSQGDNDASAQYRQLVARTRLVPMATMVNKWAPLDREAIGAVQSLLAECARPILARMRSGGGASSERRQEQARLAIAAVTRRLRSKLTKGIPFPPSAGLGGRKTRRSLRADGQNGGSSGGGGGGHEADFDYERTVEGVQALEQQLTPLQHAIALLERQRTQEERALEADYAALRKLETNAQAEMRSWRERVRRSHALAPVDNDSAPPADAFQVRVELAKQADGDGSIFENADKELLALAAQLGNHMDSLRGNLQQIEGVVPAITRSKAALQHVLHQRLDARQYERIVLGQ